MGREVGRRTCGVVRFGDLGLPPSARKVIGRLVRDGRWQRLAPDLYATFSGPLSDRALAAAASRHAAGRGYVPAVTGLVAARALGLPWVPASQRGHVLVPADRHHASTGHVLVRRAHDHADLVTSNWGPALLVDHERAVVDGARECSSLGDVRGLVLGATSTGWASPDRLDALLDNGAVGGTAWCRRATRDARRGAASPPEAEVADSLVGLGWPFALNVEVWSGGLLVGVVDVLLLGTGVGGEVESVERHTGESLSATFERHGRFDRAGFALEHVTPSEHRRDPGAFARRLLARARDRRARGLGEPPGVRLVLRGPVLR